MLCQGLNLLNFKFLPGEFHSRRELINKTFKVDKCISAVKQILGPGFYMY